MVNKPLITLFLGGVGWPATMTSRPETMQALLHTGGLQTALGGGAQQRATAARVGETSARVDAYAPTRSKDGGGHGGGG